MCLCACQGAHMEVWVSFLFYCVGSRVLIHTLSFLPVLRFLSLIGFIFNFSSFLMGQPKMFGTGRKGLESRVNKM